MNFPYQGATFGGWTQFYWKQGPDYCAALLAKRTGRPVKFAFSRRDDFYGGSMDEGNYYFKVGFKNDGTITAVHAEGHFANAQWEGFGPGTHFEDNTAIPSPKKGREGKQRTNHGRPVRTASQHSSLYARV
jgi:CO/xanthine dehydrogenase Mo-binding subunit